MSAPTAEMRPWRITHAPDALTAARVNPPEEKIPHGEAGLCIEPVALHQQDSQ